LRIALVPERRGRENANLFFDWEEGRGGGDLYSDSFREGKKKKLQDGVTAKRAKPPIGTKRGNAKRSSSMALPAEERKVTSLHSVSCIRRKGC